ncbi:alpha-mannosidase [Microseira sp. BLCC-F43]|uniref:alpha-mannosidase n=1 Tax=Microseira sp. BLCC-F43 TaxID=3153602 RepID=UPI0035BAAC69
MNHPVTSSATNQISASIARLRQLTQVDTLASWRYCAADLPIEEITPSKFLNWSLVQLNPKGHIAWSGGCQVLWLAQQLVIPYALQEYPLTNLCLRLALTWWVEDVQIFINGTLVQSGDLLDYFTRVLLSESVTPGEEIIVALRLVSPSHCDGALMRSVCIYESTTPDRLEPGFIADELDVLQRYLAAFNPEHLDILAAAISQIDWQVLQDRELFDRSLTTLRQTLQSSKPVAGLWDKEDKEDKEDFSCLPNTGDRIQSKIYLLGHAHLDMAWLWPVAETWKAAQRTFESVLNLQAYFPDLIFCHSTPALYAWLEEHRPDLFAAIQNKVKSGEWEIVGGMWIEPDLNLIDGESIVRQILYGQRYVQAKFNQISTVAWVPDTFGFCATLPQFLKQGGIEYFVTQKLAWNDTTKFPYGAFWWQSPDGTQIFSLMSALIGESIDPIKMASYAVDWQLKTQLPDVLWLPGVGDHGGGPTRDMLEIAQRWQKSPFFPQLQFTTANTYLSALAGKNPSHSQFPIWQDELYLEFHRGCYTTHADQKRWNRRCEGLLYQAELFASLATIAAGATYPKAELEDAWKKALFNQFHDILPGTSITQVFVEANQVWQEVEQVATQILEASLDQIATQISLPPPPHPDALPIIIFNPLNWQRSEVVAIPLPDSLPYSPPSQGGAGGDLWQVFDHQGQPLVTQLRREVLTTNPSALLFIAPDIPSIGYRLFWLCPQNSHIPNSINFPSESELIWAHLSHYEYSIAQKIEIATTNWNLENEYLRVTVDPETGNLSSAFDKIHNREILDKTGGNQLQAFKDSGQYWDAWNIDPNYEQHPLPPAELKSIEWIDYGPIEQRLRVVRQIGQSQFCQDYILQTGSPVLKIATKVDWQERGVLVKAAFPLNLEAESATYEIACGAICRPTQPQKADAGMGGHGDAEMGEEDNATCQRELREKAKWEVPAIRWADLTEMGNGEENNQLPIYGVSLLNDCKYGYDSKPNQLRLTLLRSPSWPDPEADRGYHEFTYAIYPHANSWQSAHTVRRGYELNQPLQVRVMPAGREEKDASLPPVGCFLDLGAQNLILMALKQSEDNPQQWILRCYECHGEVAELSLRGDGGLAIAQMVDLLERALPIPEAKTSQISPWQIVSFQCQKKPAQERE